MRTTHLFLIGLSLTLPLMAQDLPEGAVKLNSQTGNTSNVEPETNETVAVVSAEDKLLADKLSFLADTAAQYAAAGELEEAERAFLRALEVAPDNAVLRLRLSTLYIQMNRYPEAVSILKALVAVYPDGPRIHNNLAWCYATGPGVRNKELALWHAREALLSAPKNPSVWNTLAEAYYAAGDYEKALRSSNRAIDLLVQVDNQTQMKEFQEQYMKIRRAQQAFKQLEGLDDE